jgi:hypothetical protein
LKDEDVSIRLRALDLLNGMVRFCAPNGWFCYFILFLSLYVFQVSAHNLQDIIHRLMEHVELSEGQVEYVYRETVFARIIKMCSQVRNMYLYMHVCVFGFIRCVIILG